MARRKSRIRSEVLDELLGGEDPGEALRSGELLAELQKRLAERALNAGDGGPPRERGGGGVGEPPERSQPEAGVDGDGFGGAGGSAGPRGALRAAADREVGPSSSGVRREGDFAVCAGDDDPGDPGARGGAVWGDGVSGVDLEGHRRGSRGVGGVAYAAFGGGVSDRVFRRFAGEGARGGVGPEQGGAPGDRGDGVGSEGDPGAVDGVAGGGRSSGCG